MASSPVTCKNEREPLPGSRSPWVGLASNATIRAPRLGALGGQMSPALSRARVRPASVRGATLCVLAWLGSWAPPVGATLPTLPLPPSVQPASGAAAVAPATAGNPGRGFDGADEREKDRPLPLPRPALAADPLPGAARPAAPPPAGPGDAPPGPLAPHDFRVLDHDRDGRVDRAESAGDPILQQAFDHFDDNADGRLSRDEYAGYQPGPGDPEPD